MANTTHRTVKPRTLQDFSWACGCSQKDDTASNCDGTCRLNEGWTLHRAQDPYAVLGGPIAVLSSPVTAGLPTYTFRWSDNNVVLGTFRSRGVAIPTPFTTGTDLMTVDWMHYELLENPDTFTHSNLERAALTEVVAMLRKVEEPPRVRDTALLRPRQKGRTKTSTHADSPDNTEIGDDYVQIRIGAGYAQTIHPRLEWQPDNIVAALSGSTESGPLLQMQDSASPVQLYEFKLTTDQTLTVSTRHQEVEAAWHVMAETYKLQRIQGKDFALADIFCFLQTDWTLPIPLEEVTALRKCIYTLATQAVKRLEHPAFTLLRNRNPVLQCEMHTFTLCLRKEIEEQSEMLIQFWLDDRRYAWISGQMSQVMTTATQTSVDLTIIHGRDKKRSGPKYQIFRHMSELNEQGVFFRCEGLGDAGEILVLPEETTPPPFQAHMS